MPDPSGGGTWAIYHLRDEHGRALCGKPSDLRHREIGLREDPTTSEPCAECLVVAVTAGD